MIRPVRKTDAAALAHIYNHYIETTIVTFATEPVSKDDMFEDICGVSETQPWLVWETHGRVAGYAMASAWKSRCAYRYSVETTIYLAPDAGGAGIGTQLYEALLDKVEEAGHHSALGGIALPNDASVRLHEKLGFEKVGHLKQVGWKFDAWVDVGYWQKVFRVGR